MPHSLQTSFSKKCWMKWTKWRVCNFAKLTLHSSFALVFVTLFVCPCLSFIRIVFFTPTFLLFLSSHSVDIFRYLSSTFLLRLLLVLTCISIFLTHDLMIFSLPMSKFFQRTTTTTSCYLHERKKNWYWSQQSIRNMRISWNMRHSKAIQFIENETRKRKKRKLNSVASN